MDQLLANLFVDSWSTTLFYSSYFNRCQPISCSYTIQQRKSLLEIVTTIGGGLSTIFKFLSPYTISVFFYIIHRYRQRHQTTQQGEHENIRTRIIGLLRNVRDSLLKLNIFEDMNNPNDTTKFPTNAFTFSGTAFAHFQSMLIMFVSSQMLNENLFYRSTNSTLEDFQSSLSNSFIHNLQIFRGLSQGNAFVSIYSTNWDLYLANLYEDQTIYMKSHSYGGCDCAISSSCIQNSTPVVTGYVVGCLPLESYLRSTLECLYFQSCLDQISSNTSLFPIPTPLNQAESRFTINTTNNDIVQEMFTESWSNDVSDEKFFDKCRPKSCSYIVTERYNWIYVLTG